MANLANVNLADFVIVLKLVKQSQSFAGADSYGIYLVILHCTVHWGGNHGFKLYL